MRAVDSGRRNPFVVLTPFAVLAVLAASFHVACGPPRSPDGSGSGGRSVIQNKGSDTLVNVAQSWAEAYGAVRPDVAVAVSGGGTGTGIAAVINGTADIANASRVMDEKEREAATSRGRTPVEFVVGHDALAVYVHPANPLTDITLERLAGIYGEDGFERWSQLGIEVPGCRDQKLVVVNRQNNSGTYEYFRSAVLGSRDYRLGTYDLHGSKDVVDLVRRTPCAIGYSGLAYQTRDVKALCVAAELESDCVVPSVAAAVDRTYVISRPLLLYTAGEPAGAVKDYIDWILGAAGQCILEEKGYAPARPVDCSSR